MKFWPSNETLDFLTMIAILIGAIPSLLSWIAQYRKEFRYKNKMQTLESELNALRTLADLSVHSVTHSGNEEPRHLIRNKIKSLYGRTLQQIQDDGGHSNTLNYVRHIFLLYRPRGFRKYVAHIVFYMWTISFIMVILGAFIDNENDRVGLNVFLDEMQKEGAVAALAFSFAIWFLLRHIARRNSNPQFDSSNQIPAWDGE